MYGSIQITMKNDGIVINTFLIEVFFIVSFSNLTGGSDEWLATRHLQLPIFITGTTDWPKNVTFYLFEK